MGGNTFLYVHIPEVNTTLWVYTVARAGLGVIAVDVSAMNTVANTPLGAVYFDFRQHLPLPEKWQSYELPNGLSLETSNPRDYTVRYIGHDDTELEWNVRGLMDPYDILDPNMDPLASGDPDKSGFGQAYANHFDMTVHITGTTKIRGRSFNTDCVSVMDHSWGQRNEHLQKFMVWINAVFGEDYSIHAIWSRDPNADGWDEFTIAHGYALVDGEVRGLKAGRMRATRGPDGKMPVSYEMVVVDVEDREHVLVASPTSQIPWACYSNFYVPMSALRWHTHDGTTQRVGHGMAQESNPLDRLTGQSFREEGRA